MVEKVFGVCKRRFPILAYGCRLQINTFLTINVATAVLHNFARRMGEIELPPPEEIDEHILNQLIENSQIPAVSFFFK